MRRITVRSYETYKKIRWIIGGILLMFLILFACAFFTIVYRGIENKDYPKFSYALFAANAIICNSLLAFGRSPVFIDRSDEYEKN